MTWHSIPSDDVAEKITFVNDAAIKAIIVDGAALCVCFDGTHQITMKTPSHPHALSFAKRLTHNEFLPS